MRILICAAGSGRRWGNHLGMRKHLAPVQQEPIIFRTRRLLEAKGFTDIRTILPNGITYDMPDEVHIQAGLSNTEGRLATRPWWRQKDRTMLLWGDIWFSEAAIDIVSKQYDGWVQFTRLGRSKKTGKPGPEIFGVQFDPSSHDDYVQALKASSSNAPGWSTYCHMTGHPVTPSVRIRDWGKMVHIPDDGTDDFDFPGDYHRWLKRCRDLIS